MGEANSGEFVAVAAQDNDSDTEAAFSVVHSFEHQGAFGGEATPGVEGAEAPVFSEGHGRGEDLPVDVRWLGGAEVAEQGLELSGTEDGGVRVQGVEGIWGGAVGAGVEHEEGGWTTGELEVGYV